MIYDLFEKNRMKINMAKATFTGHSHRHTPAATAGHPEGTKPELGEDKRAAEGGRETQPD
jgi:hypothetical protein